MLRLNLAREPWWLDLGHDVRIRVEPLTTALMVAARSDPAVRGLPEGTGDDEIAVVFGKALAERAILDWEGVGDAKGKPAPVTPEAIAAVFATNFAAPVALAHAVYPALAAAGGRLGLVGSVAHRGAAAMPVYAASKAALDGFGRALASEWAGRVAVRVLHPGPTATGMAVRAGRTPDIADRLMLPPDAVAAALLAAFEARGGGYRRKVSYGRVGAHRLFGARA